MLSLFFCKQKTAYEMRISDWSSDVCSSDLEGGAHLTGGEVENGVPVGVVEIGARGPLDDERKEIAAVTDQVIPGRIAEVAIGVVRQGLGHDARLSWDVRRRQHNPRRGRCQALQQHQGSKAQAGQDAADARSGDRKSAAEGTRVSARVDSGARLSIKKTNTT